MAMRPESPTTMRALFFVSMLVVGCPKKNHEPVVDPPADSASLPMPDPPRPSATPPSSLRGGWRAKVTSNDPSINLDMFEGKRAKIFFDHTASVKHGQVVVEHAELAPTSATADDAQTLDDLVHETDWAALENEAASEPPSEGGTTFVFEIQLGDTSLLITTSNPADYPALAKLLDLLKKTSGAPG